MTLKEGHDVVFTMLWSINKNLLKAVKVKKRITRRVYPSKISQFDQFD